MRSVDKRYRGIASGMHVPMRSFGHVLSMAITMFGFSVFIGIVSISPTIFPARMTSVTVSLFLFTYLCVIGVGTSYVLGTIHE